MKKIAVFMEGGVIQQIIGDEEVEVILVDNDKDIPEDERTNIPVMNGPESTEEYGAYASLLPVDKVSTFSPWYEETRRRIQARRGE
jgi:hypothetical protein